MTMLPRNPQDRPADIVRGARVDTPCEREHTEEGAEECDQRREAEEDGARAGDAAGDG
jgi:hypothetical protein